MEEYPYYHNDDGNSCLQVIVFLLCLGGCSGYQWYSSCDHKPEKAKTQVVKDTLTEEEKAREAYEDSVEFVEWEKKYEEHQKKTTEGFIVDGDSLMHRYVHDDIPLEAKITLISEYEYIHSKYKLCEECKEREHIYDKFVDYDESEYISRDLLEQEERDKQEAWDEMVREEQYW